MDANSLKPRTVDEYILAFEPETRVILEELRAFIQSKAPQAEEVVSYAMPTYKLNGNLVHFAGYKNHIGFYPGAGGVAEFQDEITNYKSAKGSIQFPINKPMPYDLIGRIVEFRVQQNLAKPAKKTKTKA